MANMNNGQPLFRAIIDIVRQIIALNAEQARLSAAEKMSMLYARIIFSIAVAVVGFFALVFLSVGAANALSTTAVSSWAYMIVGGFYVVILIVLLLAMRRRFSAKVTPQQSKQTVDMAQYVDLLVTGVKLWQSLKKNN